MNKKYFSFILAAAIFFFWASWQTRPLPLQTGAQGKTLHDEATPLITLTTVALGGFRGLLVDLLWMRLITIQAEGKVFEIAQLADWITKLEPQFTTVWSFHAWNMAYNISILFSNPEHRWLWIRNGIQLLRDEALQYNPNDPVLYHDLGWLYQHKIGQEWDDMHFYYKIKLAEEMTELFGGARPDFSKAAGLPATVSKKMRNEYKLYPEIMQAIERKYCPFDWRMPESHAIYWAYRGLHEAAPGKDTSSCDHMLFQCLAAEFRHGRLFFDPKAGIYVATPLFTALPGTLKAYEEGIKRRHSELFETAYINFLAEAVFFLHAYGKDGEAKQLFDRMLSEAPQLRGKMNFEKYLRDCDQTDIARLPSANAVAVIEGLLFQSYAPSSTHSSERAQALQSRAKMLWEQYMKSNDNPMTLKYFPSFALIEGQARQRALKIEEGTKNERMPEHQE